MNPLLKLLCITLLGWTAPWAVVEAAPAEVRLAAYKVVPAPQPGARESLQPLEEVSPGDTVEYQADYVNSTGQTARGVQLTIPIPAGGLELMAGQKAPLAASGSVDGTHFAPLPLTRAETLADGRRVTREVPLAEYRALRWSLGDVPAGASRQVRARMQLPATTSAR